MRNSAGAPLAFEQLAYGQGHAPINRRDASQPSKQDAAGPWTQPPTAIHVPARGSTQPFPSAGGNPFSGRLSNNLKGPTTGRDISNGNRPRQSTVVGPHPQKRQKVAQSSTSWSAQPSSSVKSKHFPPGAGRTMNTSRANNFASRNEWAEPIEIGDDDVDTGVRVQRPYEHERRRSSSRDPIDFIEDSRDHHAFETLPDPPPRTLPKDGSSTLRLQNRIQGRSKTAAREPVNVDSDTEGEDAADPIQSASDLDVETGRHTTPHGTAMRRGNVKEKTRKIEMVVENERQKKPPPTINLNKVKPVKSKMRAKGEPFTIQPSVAAQVGMNNLDAVATTSSGFTSKPKKSGPEAARPSTTTIALPLKQWALGSQIYGDEDEDDINPQWWLMYQSVKAVLEVRKGKDIFRTFNNDARTFNSFEVEQGDSVIIQITTTLKESSVRGNKKDKPYQPGSDGAQGKIAFKFITRHANWQNGDSYNQLVKELEAKISKPRCLNEHGARAVWEGTVRAANYWQSNRGTGSSNGGKEGKPSSPGPSTMPRPTPKPVSRVTESLTDASEKTTRRSTRLLRPSPENLELEPDTEPDELILVYPPSGAGGITINKSDLKRLGPHQYLNDTLIEFGLKLWLNTLRESEPELAEQVHVFSSFFYKKLNVKNKEEGYQSVRKWTSKFDLFKKKYIIVPINEHFHWYFAMIYKPEHVLAPPPPIDLDSPPKRMTRKRKREAALDDAEVAESTELLAEVPAPEEDIVPDSRPPSPAHNPATPSAESDQHEVEMLLEPTRSCTIADDRQPSHATDSTISDETDNHSTEAVVADGTEMESIRAMQLQYPSSPSPTKMDIDEPVSPPQVEMAEDNPDGEVVARASVSAESKDTAQGETISDSVAPASFYGSAPSRKGKERERGPPLDLDEQHEDVDEPVLSDLGGPARSTTYIFTFDSLGTRHIQVINTLTKYLEMEARDKKGLEQTSSPYGKQALVPTQPNFCDCGVYVLHLVQTFMQDPTRFCQLIFSRTRKDYPLDKREADWGNHNVVNSLRETLAKRIEELSEEWKKDRELKEVQRKKDAGERQAESSKPGSTTPAVSVVDSDDEIIIGEVKQPSPKGKGRARARQKAVAGKDEMQPAERFR